jgi:hypothetical protein
VGTQITQILRILSGISFLFHIALCVCLRRSYLARRSRASERDSSGTTERMSIAKCVKVMERIARREQTSEASARSGSPNIRRRKRTLLVKYLMNKAKKIVVFGKIGIFARLKGTNQNKNDVLQFIYVAFILLRLKYIKI